MDRKLPTFGQLERQLSQKMHKLYREELEHSPKKITCKFFSNNLAIVIEDALTRVEKSLLDVNGDREIVEKMNSAINDILQPKLKVLIEEILSVEVENILLDSNFTTRSTGAIFTLSQLPLVRAARPITKSKQPEEKEDLDRLTKSKQPEVSK